jgi:hypothetical protein
MGVKDLVYAILYGEPLKAETSQKETLMME